MTYSWDERYARPGISFGDKPNDFLASQEQLIRTAGKATLCLGEGECRNAIWLAQLGLEVTAVDLSAVGLQNGAERAASLGVKLTTIHADLSVWDMKPNGWDLIVSIFCHLPKEIRESVHRKVTQALKPNGLFILEAYAPSQINRGTGGPSDPNLLASTDQLTAELEGLHYIHIQSLSREVVEGHRHTGMADVVQVIAQKTSIGRFAGK